ncbi:MAG TPA: carbohydrate porin [Caulobacteraceae bacterium]
MIARFLVMAALVLSPAVAIAQAQPSQTLPPLLIPIEPPDQLPDSGTQGGYLFNLRPLGADLGRKLADDGVYIVGRGLYEGLGNVDGGVKRGVFAEGFTAFGVDLDMDRIAGIKGGAIHILVDDVTGQSFAAFSGSSWLNNRIFAGDGPGLHLNEFNYEQLLFNDRVDLRVGRIPAYTQFDGSELYCTFITSLCRTPAGYTFNRGYPPYVTSSWAGVAQVRISGPFYANVAVFENEPILAQTNHASFPGPDWSLQYADGVTVPVQFGYRTTIDNDDYPRAFSIGGFYNTESYADPLLNTNGLNRILNGGAPKTDVGASMIYIQGQQMIYRPDRRNDRGLTIFGGADWATSGEPNIKRMIFGGAFYKGLFPSRPHDTAGLAISLVNPNPLVTERIDSMLALTTGGAASHEEIGYEVNYGIAMAPGFSIKPFVQFISHPDQNAVAAPSGNNTHAIFVGALLEWNLANVFGLPNFPR